MVLIKEAAVRASKYSSIAVIGGGIGGLSVANALLHRSDQGPTLTSHVSVYEQANSFIPTAGAGFGFSPNGQLCLSSIGIHDYRNFCQPFDTMKRLDINGTDVVQQAPVFKELREKYGVGFAGCLRADLIDLLVNKLNEYDDGIVGSSGGSLRYSQKLIGIAPHKDKVELRFESGHEDVVDLVIGADGIHSSVARLLNIDDEKPPIYSGANIFYGKIPNPDKIDFLHDHPIFDEGSVVNGPGTGEFIGFHVGSGAKQTFVWANTYVSTQPPQKREEWNSGNLQELDDILLKYPASHPIHTLAKFTRKNDLLHFGLFYRHHKKTWTHDRVVLLGDACHATLPYVGQGANQAIEDAVYLADCLDRHDTYKEAYREYYDKRFPRTKRIVQMAGLMHKLYHSESWFMHKALDVLISSVMKGGLVLRQLEREIVDECPVPPPSVK